MFGLLSGCGCSKDENGPGNTPSDIVVDDSGVDAQKDNPQDTESRPEGLPEVSENKEVVTSDKTPKIFVEEEIKGMTYHLEGCEVLNGKTKNEVSWEFVQTIGLWQCPECNPPRYENYTNAD